MEDILNAGTNGDVVQPQGAAIEDSLDSGAATTGEPAQPQTGTQDNGEAVPPQTDPAPEQPNAEGGEADNYKIYRTQQEWQQDFDQLLGQRLGQVRQYKKGAERYNRLSDKLQSLFGTANADEAMDLFSRQYAEVMAEREGVSPEQFLENQELKSKAARLDQLQQERAQEIQAQQRMNEIRSQVSELERKNPDFNMDKEVENQEFCQLIWNRGLSVEDAYFLTHREELYKQAQSAVVNNIAAKQTRIPENGTGKVPPTVNKINPSKLTFDEIDEINRRVQNGEKIYL